MTYATTCRSTQHLGEVTNLAAYLERVNAVLDGATQGLFRGHRDADWMLKPGVARQTFNVRAEDESAMLEEFKRRAIPYLESSYDLSETDWLAIAQHHGMPTRLLDWSGSALAALWFAVNKPAAANASGAVWILEYGANDLMTDQERKAPFSIKRTALVRPRHVSRRITAQDGWFTLHRSHPHDGELSSNLVYGGSEAGD
ncbi:MULTISPECIES: FRG domain-containing protein [Paraburkholderia]|uniref:FRG domain-containing protein n=1 Tax=Paraburkholderia madseniana TaxID=2599607 RepID=A0AAP5BKG2_9BURK|nr:MULTISPECIES: FRG domain-containing protein [Paraburkholderia]MCX4151410.1 FRG domain-containing protein [Paraburkholderia madseniana]MDN7154341.1 FRG domain-containing protein [Paraburkholderia sp. WS6]MDQ6413223.1 FRG domain-containing protein [Paraburkholderia madseniana]